MVRYLPFLISLTLSVYALFSCIQTPDDEVPHLPKLVWILLIVLVPFIGPITWLLMSWQQRTQAEADPVVMPGMPPRSSAPDDDPEFLAWLDRQQRRNRPPDPPEPKDKDESGDDAQE